MRGASVTWDVRGVRGSREMGEPVCWAGDRLAGSVSLWIEHDLACRGIDLQLCYRTSGKCTPEHVVVQAERIWAGPAARGQAVESRFDLLLPAEGPVSYEGKHFRLEWLVRLRIDLPLWRDPTDDRLIVVRPRGAA